MAAWARQSLPVLLGLAAWTAALYGVAHRGGVISDGWVLLGIGAQGLAKAPFVLLSYHTIPVANLMSALLWKTWGLSERGYEITNLFELTLTGFGLYLFGRPLFGARLALLASIAFVANPAHYEVPFWPLVGNFQSLAALLSLAAVAAAWRSGLERAGGGGDGRAAALVFFVASLLAFGTYEPTVSLLPVGLTAALLAGDEGRGREPRWRARIAAAKPVAMAVAVLAAVALASKAWTGAHGHDVAFLPGSLTQAGFRLFLLVRGALAILTLTGSDDSLYTLVTIALPPWVSQRLVIGVAWWLVVFGLVILWALRRAGPAVRLLVLWMAAHLAISAAATDIVSRHFYIAALPGCLLLVVAVDACASLAERRWRSAAGAPRVMAATLAAVAVALLVARGKSDLDVARGLYLEASQASADVRDRLALHFAARTPRSHALLVDMPANLTRDGIGIMPFVNGISDLARLAVGLGPGDFWLVVAGGPFVVGRLANDSIRMPIRELLGYVADPDWCVLAFDPAARRIRRLDPETFPPPTYAPAEVPFLRWYADPFLREWTFTVDDALDLPLATPGCAAGEPAARCRVRLVLLAEPGREAEIRIGESTKALAGEAIATPHWHEIVLPASRESTTWIHVERRGASPVLVRELTALR